MDTSNKTLIVAFLIIYINCMSGVVVLRPDKLVVDILDGEVMVHWNQPADAPSNSQYNVQMANYNGNWTMVASCTGITKTYCDLSSLIHDYHGIYKVKIGLVTGDVTSWSIPKKFVLSTSKLRPPSFTLWPTSSSLTVSVHQKPILRKLFSYGPTYTIYLEERGQDNKNTTAYMKDDMEEEDLRTKTFSSLRRGREYCVSMKVEGTGEILSSSVSPKQCVRLPEHEWFIIAVTFLSILGMLACAAVMAAILLCYLRRPEKTPAVLKSPVTGWLPVSVVEENMEVVTDKGWFLSSHRTEVKNCVKDSLAPVTTTEDKGEEDRRTSMDSGVSIESNSTTNPPMRQEDSGCGSLGGPESSTSGQTDYPLQEERTDTHIARKMEDSGVVVGLGCQLLSSSINLDGQDGGSLKEAVAGGNYRSQRPSAVQIHVCDDEEVLPGSALAEVVTGYRVGPQSCICSGAGQCTWCHKQGIYETEVIKQYRAMRIDNGLLSSKCNFVDSYKRGITFSSYSKKTQIDTVVTDDLETTFIQLGETFPLLTALTPLPLVEGRQDFNMNNVSLSLCDVQLTAD
ncbi:interleukin-10 receptor subunit alpha [Chelmon rostratus]|uniref:interleukin-10 receptor subunit alpha n=1 Tax=Chelmon rostratus TaxID=109905 RepID=UPI001BE59E04|nr:interleukin-10 receptor subunit alpha [Chelmon rostratus]